MKTNQEFKNAALDALKGRWPQVLVATIAVVLMALLIMGPYSSINTLVVNGETISSTFILVSIALFFLGGLLVFSPMNVGYTYALYQLYVEGDERVTGNSFRNGFGTYFRNVWGMFLVGLFVNLWSLLLIVPGFVKMYSYALTPYILIDYPELSANQAINLSKKMMKGHKFDLFFLQLSFIGWGILSVLTLCVGLLWLVPYMTATQAAFYQNVKNEYLSNNN
ncbi:MAG: DUF975 family protein [Bacteroidales bacterium]|nr:DUF975 family protein [Bacteroidales bacterium]